MSSFTYTPGYLGRIQDGADIPEESATVRQTLLATETIWTFTDITELYSWVHPTVRKFWSQLEPRLMHTITASNQYTLYMNGDVAFDTYGLDAEGHEIMLSLRYHDLGELFEDDKFRLHLRYRNDRDDGYLERTSADAKVSPYEPIILVNAEKAAHHMNWIMGFCEVSL